MKSTYENHIRRNPVYHFGVGDRAAPEISAAFRAKYEIQPEFHAGFAQFFKLDERFFRRITFAEKSQHIVQSRLYADVDFVYFQASEFFQVTQRFIFYVLYRSVSRYVFEIGEGGVYLFGNGFKPVCRK